MPVLSVADQGRRISAVVFDVGGVLLDWDPRHLYRKIFSSDAQMEWFLGHICTTAWHQEHDRGTDIRASCETLAARHPAYAAAIRAWAERGEEMIRGTVPGVVELLDALAEAGVPCYALTNMERETFPLRRARYPFFRLFGGILVSGQEGVLKPEPAIFDLVQRRFGLTPATTLFIDDSPPNIDAANRFGFQTHLFSDAGRLQRALVELHLLTV
jgi:2-haloacid dehalogenase